MVAFGGEAASDQVGKLVRFLAEDREFTGIEIAETLWLALQIKPVADVEPETPVEAQAESLDSEDFNSAQDLKSEALNDDLEDLSDDHPSPPSPPPRANLTTAVPQTGVLPPQVLPVWLADPALLTDPLAIIRALKPLLKSLEVGLGRKLDEAATVDQIARTQLWIPILASEREPWFEILLVVDRGSSMQIWQRLITDLVRILRQYGAFRDLQVFDLEVNRAAPPDERVLLRAHPDRPGHRPKELIDQRGRRIAIVLSDCAGTYWWDGTLLPMLQAWGKIMPTVIWQMLPEWMWERTALGRGEALAISNDLRGACNQQLKPRILERQTEDVSTHRIPMPVVTSELRDLANWSLMLAGDRREITPGFWLPQQGGAVPKSRTIEEMARDRVEQHGSLDQADWDAALAHEIETIARSRVERFRRLASPQACRLVMLLAAAPVITLPVMRLIRDSMLYKSSQDGAKSPLPIAEVFLSGLLQRLPGQESFDPEQVQYDFVPRVRELLLQILPAIETIDVINSVSAVVEQRWNRYSTQDFRAFLTDPRVPAPEGLEGLRSFASVTATILEQLGGDYAAFARQLRQGTGELPPEQADLEEIRFPELEPFEFIDAQLGYTVEPDNAFPPPLQTETFTVVTVEVEAEPEVEPDPLNRIISKLRDFVEVEPEPEVEPELERPLDSFQFTVATLQRRGTQWVIQRQQQSARRFFEPLPDAPSLEMVAIPGGTFLMGSPDNEPQRSNNEFPQHEVTVAPFCMGRYPVTQAQWLAVAVMPQVQRALDPTPSHFKGDNRPVERVSWNDAVEFCARLSAYTGQPYRLPSEAEWEYACRVGTTTPFHFGDMITTELANYDGNYSYNGGPQGEYRATTTPVDQFGIANAFGLSDMHGNVSEWCADQWHSSYENAPTDGSAWSDETGSEQRLYVRRGGSWYYGPRLCRSAVRVDDVLFGDRRTAGWLRSHPDRDCLLPSHRCI